MFKINNILLFIALLQCVIAVAAKVNIERSKGATVIGEWMKLAKQPAVPDKIEVLLALRHSAEAVAALNDAAWAVSDPLSKQYGDHLTVDEITELMAPPEHKLNHVTEWLRRELGADSLSLNLNRDLVLAHVSRAKAEAAFGVNLSWWRNQVNGRVLLRSPSHPLVPAALDGLVDLVHNLSEMPPAKRRTAATGAAGAGLTARLQQDHAAVKRATGASTAPDITVALSRGGNKTFALQVRPRCPSGEWASSVPPCGLADVKFSVTYAGLGSPLVLPGRCSANKVANSSTIDVECMISGVPTQYYTPVRQLTVRTVFSSSSMSDPFVSAFPVVASPAILPSTIRDFYTIEPNRHVVSAVTQAVVEFEDQYYTPADLALLFEATGLPTTLTKKVKVIGPNDESKPGVEANLDIQYLMALAPGAETTFWSNKAKSTVEIDDILKWSYDVMNTTTVPFVFSVSYGMTETLVDKFQGNGYLARSEIEFTKMAARGLTLIVASGDTGTGDLGDPPMSLTSCKTHNNADWPSNSPSWTSVGSTLITPYSQPMCNFPPSKGGIDCREEPLGEVITSLDQGLFWGAGGGFSQITKRPRFQAKAVEKYLALAEAEGKLPPSSFFSRDGRAYPDVVTVGHNFEVYNGGVSLPVDGTSASAPTFSAMITLLNDARFRAGIEKPLGWLNPFLYLTAELYPEAFRDVVVGNNRCGAYPGKADSGVELCCPHGFHAVPGFDAASGLGSPRYQVLQEAALAFVQRQ